MIENSGQRVHFDVLLVGPEGARPGDPTVETIDQFKPPATAEEKVRRWLHSRGVTCHRSGFGLSCSAPKEVFEDLFSVEIRPVKRTDGLGEWRAEGVPVPPKAIAGLVFQVTLVAPPDLF